MKSHYLQWFHQRSNLGGWEWDFRTSSTGLEAAEAFKAELVELLFSLEAHWVVGVGKIGDRLRWLQLGVGWPSHYLAVVCSGAFIEISQA